jgi:spore coat polysaccharide biosynthesis protein SpsF
VTVCAIILQARMGSGRLPGKVLMPVLGKPLLAYELERLQRVDNADALLVATTRLPEDDAIAALCAESGVPCHRGSETDVLDRYCQAAREVGAGRIVRVTGDCPLIDPEVVGAVIDAFDAAALSREPADYLSNTLERTFPRGLDVEVFSRDALETAWREAVDPAEREHVTPFIYRRPERFRIQQYRQAVNRSHLRWTVDVPEDFRLVETILTHLYPEKPDFGQEDVLRLLGRHPAWSAINAHVEQVCL